MAPLPTTNVLETNIFDLCLRLIIYLICFIWAILTAIYWGFVYLVLDFIRFVIWTITSTECFLLRVSPENPNWHVFSPSGGWKLAPQFIMVSIFCALVMELFVYARPQSIKEKGQKKMSMGSRIYNKIVYPIYFCLAAWTFIITVNQLWIFVANFPGVSGYASRFSMHWEISEEI